MVFLPDKPHDPLKHAMGDWGRWRDGAPINLALPPPQPPQYACEIKYDFVSQDRNKIQYRKGMQGHFLGESLRNGVRFARIFIHGVTPHGPNAEDQNAWVPIDRLIRGSLWKDNIKDWHIDISLLPNNVRLPSVPHTNDKLAQTITALLQSFADNPASFTGTCSEYVSQQGVQNVSSAIQQGIREAGVYNVLGQDDCSYAQLVSAAKWKISGSTGQGKTGVYARFQTSKQDVDFWMPNTRYGYVGKTGVDYSERFRSHKQGRHKYAILNQNSNNITSFALCFIRKELPTRLFFIAEQILLCLLGTYKANVLPSARGPASNCDSKWLAILAGASYCVEMATKVFDGTGFVPLLQRSSFEATEGANSKSPICEMEEGLEKLLWLRTDYQRKDQPGPNMPSYTMAEFRRHASVKVNYKHPSKLSKTRRAYLFYVPGVGKNKQVQAFRLKLPPNQNKGVDYPIDGTHCQIVIEARLDGESHRYSWARLPSVAMFSNWKQANSFAVRVEWEHPPGSGTWRCLYVQPDKKLFERFDKDTPGSLRRYAKATAVIHWIFGKTPSYTQTWIPKPFGSMQVFQVAYDLMAQTIRFKTPEKPYSIVPIVSNSTQNIRNQMQALNIGSNAQGSGAWGRRMCDLCILLVEDQMSPESKQCTVAEGEVACGNCKTLGLAYCPWTPGFKSYKFRSSQTLEQKDISDRIYAALLRSPPADMTKVTFKQNIQSLGTHSSAGDVAEDSDDEVEEVEVEGDDSD